MIVKSETELWVQGLYGQNWEDMTEVIDREQAIEILHSLRKGRNGGKFRLIERKTTDSLKEGF